ncbi:MAG: 1-deoxy-D-xylulose-5-phosphate reductoisomerase [Candidatus Porifericomitaceae bacterium WSBS_2022_MAG_OTU9]
MVAELTAGVAVLGCTGSIGKSALDVLARHPDRFQVTALAANSDLDGMLSLCRKWQPKLVAMADVAAAASLQRQLPGVEVLQGPAGVATLAADGGSEIVVHGISGADGLCPALAAVQAGKRLLLANKESLVMAGPLLLAAAEKSKAHIIPLDSEHNAALQCLPPAGGVAGVESLILTASGGALRELPLQDLAAVTPEQACTHPNWSMGAKITVDSATMMNKGLEVIEACHLFSLPLAKVQVLLHPQSIVHAMVQYSDGSVLAHMAWPDMRAPISYALSWPESRCDSGVAALNLAQIARLDFASPDYQRYPCLSLARAAMTAGGAAPIVLNAANEVAVQAFLDGRMAFTAIADLVSSTMDAVSMEAPSDLEGILAVDAGARRMASVLL